MLSGKDKGKTGKVMVVDPKGGKVTVENVNVSTKHQAPKKQGQEGGIIKVDTPIARLQGSACLPQVRQAHPRWPQAGQRKKDPRLPQVRRGNMRGE